MLWEFVALFGGVGFLFLILSMVLENRRVLFSLLAFLIFFIATFGAFNLDIITCDKFVDSYQSENVTADITTFNYTKSWDCHTENVYDVGVPYTFFGIALFSVIWFLASVFIEIKETADTKKKEQAIIE